jgi:hypothetical protein
MDSDAMCSEHGAPGIERIKKYPNEKVLLKHFSICFQELLQLLSLRKSFPHHLLLLETFINYIPSGILTSDVDL